MVTEENLKEEGEQPLLTSVDVVCREVEGLTASPYVARRIEVFLDYSPQYLLHRACWFLTLRLVKRVFASQTWDQERVVDGIAHAAMEGKLDVIEWLCRQEKKVAGIETIDLLTGFNRWDYCSSPLCMAAGSGHVHVLQWLVENGADVNEEDYTGRTALLEAASDGHFSAVQWLIQKGAHVNDADRDGDTALHGAVADGHLEVVKYLVECGAHLKQTNSAGMTVLHCAVCVSEEDHAVIRHLVDLGLQASDTDKRGRTVLYYASAAKDFETAEFLLREYFKDNKPPIGDLRSTFVEAVKVDRLDLVRYLSEYGVDIHFVNFRGWNALHGAAAAGAITSAGFLLDRGVDFHLADKFGITPVMEACRNGHHGIVLRLIESGGGISNVDLAGQSALHLAAQGGHKDIVELLLKYEADIHCYDERGWTPIHSAATVGNYELMELLVAKGAKTNAKTLSGQTAKDLAISRGHPDVADYLKALSASKTKTKVPDLLTKAVFSEYLLDPIEVHFNSVTTAMQCSSDGSWLDAPISVRVKKHNWSSKNFVEVLETWSQLNHPHVVQLYGFCHFDDAAKEPYFVCERTAYESLYDYLRSDAPLDDVWDKLYQVALGLQYLHDRNIVHGSLSAYNVAVASNGVTKLHAFDGITEKYLSWYSAPEVLAGLPSSFKSDIFVFGFIIIDAIKRGGRIWSVSDDKDAILSGQLPDKPEDMTASQWSLIERMCCYDYHERPSASDVVRELEVIARHYSTIRELAAEPETHDANEATISWADISGLRVAEFTVRELLDEVHKMCEGSTTIDQMNRDVHVRLIDIFSQLTAQTGEPAMDVVYRYVNIVRYFHMRLQTTSAVGPMQAARFAASRQGADDTFSVHQDINNFAETSGLSLSPQVHQWREQWELRRQQQKREMLKKLENLPALFEDVEDEKEREEALTYLRFELSKHPTSYATSTAADFTRAKSTIATLASTVKNPNWFIPAHEVHFHKFDEFSRGAFGKVYHGKWKRSRVVVKKVKLRDEEDQAAFLKEVEVWQKLYHPNVVQLYGACHIQKPFFVCEFAGNGQLDNYLRDHPDEMWQKLYEAALGLRYLHVKRIVHGDLKCNNILVGSDGSAKLTDFGLSIMEVSAANGNAEPESDPESGVEGSKKASIGAIRWKAPEVLRGEKATSASDIYSFGMCIIEAVSGKFPWGMTLDPVVKYYVLKKKKIPQRPVSCSEEAYALVERMCQFESSTRIGMNHVVDALKTLR